MKKAFFLVLAVGQLAGAAWALDCSRSSGSLPDPGRPAGKSDAAMPIDHIVVIMQENHSFDTYLGRLVSDGYPGVEGITPELGIPGTDGKPFHAFHQTALQVEDIGHSWNDMHAYWNGGKNDRFVSQGGERTIGYYERTELPYYYELANEFAIADHYHCGVLGPTFPNRYFLYTGTAFGHIQNDLPTSEEGFSQKTIFDVLEEHGITWKYYVDWAGYLPLFGKRFAKPSAHVGNIADYEADLKADRLPQVAFIESIDDKQDEHPPADVQVGQQWVKERITALQQSSAWSRTVLFLTYDENGGFYDHVPPPAACLPDGIAPRLEPDSTPGTYDRLGFRVPLFAVSPWVKRHYVSHGTYSHTSILKFIETKFNLPALTRRDANADGMLDLFQFPPPPNPEERLGWMEFLPFL